jgi:hypothetical protein
VTHPNPTAVYDLPKLDPEKKALWLRALRSEEYAQGREQLRSRGDKFCCLGVACDVFKGATGRGEWQEDGQRYSGEYTFHLSDEDRSWSSLPHAVVEWLGLPTPGPDAKAWAWAQVSDLRVIGEDGRPVPLSNLNDEGASFAEIADLIERDL